ncbi:hypothetical protein HWV62_7380 [Athelia sp. TMB]|nr:hypothetical protein HWV62_7380 [Athelia sp. TMB]
MLPRLSIKSARSALPRLSQSQKLLSNMSTKAFIVPIDPAAPSSQSPSGVDAAKLWSTVPKSQKTPKVGSTRTFYDTPAGDANVTTLVSLGEGFEGKAGPGKRELVRKAIGSAVKDVKALVDGETSVAIDASSDPHAAAVAAYLANYKFTLKTDPPSAFNPNLKDALPEKIKFEPFEASKEWDAGVIAAKAQNLARTAFCERVQSEFKGVENVEIFVRDEAWAAEKGMRTFLSVTAGTSEPAKFLEIHYKGAADKSAQPLALVGKGITFDSGGISLKPGAGMKLMRGDMGGAATVVSSALAIAQLKIPINYVAVTPLCENMPGPSATKPGDIIYAMNGKTVEVDNTDAEGRLVLSDAIYYTSTVYKPHTLIDLATLTGFVHIIVWLIIAYKSPRAMVIALGEIYSGVFSTSDTLWEELHAAGEVEHDRFWRMPLEDEYGPQIYSSNADLQNTGGREAGSCTAALFLKAFVEGIEAEEGKEAPLRVTHQGYQADTVPRKGNDRTPRTGLGRVREAALQLQVVMVEMFELGKAN